MCSEITQDELEKLSYKTLDELYESYEIKHSKTFEELEKFEK